MRAHFCMGDVERDDFTRFHMDDAILNLELSVDAQNAAAGDHQTVRFKHIRRNDDVGNAGFVFKREKYEAPGGPPCPSSTRIRPTPVMFTPCSASIARRS